MDSNRTLGVSRPSPRLRCSLLPLRAWASSFRSNWCPLPAPPCGPNACSSRRAVRTTSVPSLRRTAGYKATADATRSATLKSLAGTAASACAATSRTFSSVRWATAAAASTLTRRATRQRRPFAVRCEGTPCATPFATCHCTSGTVATAASTTSRRTALTRTQAPSGRSRPPASFRHSSRARGTRAARSLSSLHTPGPPSTLAWALLRCHKSWARWSSRAFPSSTRTNMRGECTRPSRHRA
mmetsp:Transcript_3163/g.10382  ORF Transcript_3163/g.10382 Transcript_3163/m.10382 type:complete len:241 (-) Transcript_3163:176-898(-)